MDHHLVVALLKEEVLPTSGCTEPGAVALAAAYACDALDAGQAIHKISVVVNANVYKNGVAVGIPGTGETGLHIAAALGAIKKHPENQLSVLAETSEPELEAAKDMVARGMVAVNVDPAKTGLWIQVRIEAGSAWTETVIEGKHTNVISVCRNGQYLLTKERASGQRLNPDHRALLSGSGVTVKAIIETIESIPLEEIEFVLDGVAMNVSAAELGLEKKLGLGIGAMYKAMAKDGSSDADMMHYAKMLTAAAADARMSGANVKIMSSAGSGNHGITVILPVYAVAKKSGASRERLARAVALSHLITVYIKIYTGNLSALCGCAVAAATGASGAITWLLGGDIQTIEAAMKNVIANLTGMICDGGKVGCALKLSTAANVAVESSLFARQRIVVPDTNGIIAPTIEDTIRNLGKISTGMVGTDKVIMDVMLDKERLHTCD